MHRPLTALVLAALILGSVVPVRAYTLQFTDGSGSVQIRWPGTTIKVALSTSLNSPPPNIKAGSDVAGAVRRALAHWSEAANIQFVEVSSSAQSISPANNGDGVSLISVADTSENRAVFNSPDRTGRTRVFYDPATGAITEADIIVNPSAQFSTDGTPGTYDLEATFTHELGHLLGLEHSGEVASAMQPRQGTNGLYESPAASPRTLSDDDRAGAHALYGARSSFGAITGTLSLPAGAAAYGAHLWVEEVATGRIMAGNVSLANGSYRIEGLPPGEYRLIAEPLGEYVAASEIASGNGAYTELKRAQAGFRTTELAEPISLAAGETARRDLALESRQVSLKPSVFGSNGHLSTIAVPLVQGRSYTIFIGGAGVDQIAGDGLSVTSPFIRVNPASLTLQSGINYQYPIISFEVEVDANAPLGDYSIRLQSKTGEVSYISGGLTVDLASGASEPATKLQFGAASYRVRESDGQAHLTVTRTGDASGAAEVAYSTSNTAGSKNCPAASPCGYAPVSGTLVFEPGETSKILTVKLVDDGHAGTSEIFNVSLNAVSGASFGANTTSSVRVVDQELELKASQLSSMPLVGWLNLFN
ncbi:MAG TPA: Calx-beta domain-containing protein [Pyrinomonadaceae bacterium]|jgi:hypothetical protein